jgi:hypothetical protein
VEFLWVAITSCRPGLARLLLNLLQPRKSRTPDPFPVVLGGHCPEGREGVPCADLTQGEGGPSPDPFIWVMQGLSKGGHRPLGFRADISQS